MRGDISSFAVLKTGLALIVGLAIIVTLVWFVSAEDWQVLAARLQPASLLMVAFFVVFIQVAEAFRVLTLSSLAPGKWLGLTRVSFASASIGILPAGWLGGDLYKAYAAAELGLNAAGAVSAVGLSRLLGVASTLFLTGLALLLAFMQGSVTGIPISVVGISPFWVLTVSLVGAAGLGMLVWRADAGLAGQVRQLAGDCWTTAQATAPARLVLATGLSVLIAAARAFLFWFSARAVGADLSLDLAFIVGGVALLINLVPVLGTTIGVREAANAGVLVSLGMEPVNAIAVALLVRVCTAVTCVIGWGVTSVIERQLNWNSAGGGWS